MLFAVVAVVLVAALPSGAFAKSLLPQSMPDASLTSQVRLGADSSSLFDARVRVYVKVDARSEWRKPVQLSVDVGPHTGLLLVGTAF